MRQLARLSDLSPGHCYRKPGRGSVLRKKLSDGRIAEVGTDRRVKFRKERGDPLVEQISCPLKYLGIGQRRHPEAVIEVGSRIQKTRG